MTDNPVSQARITLATPQSLYDAAAHLELVVQAVRGGHEWHIERAVTAAEAHLQRMSEGR